MNIRTRQTYHPIDLSIENLPKEPSVGDKVDVVLKLTNKGKPLIGQTINISSEGGIKFKPDNGITGVGGKLNINFDFESSGLGK